MAEPTAWRVTRKEYHRLGEAGFLDDDRRTELIGGEVLLMTPIGKRHAAAVGRLCTAFAPLVGQATPWVQCPVWISDDDEPQPDFCLVRNLDYEREYPGPEEVLLAIEVSLTTIRHDRLVKAPLYSRAGLPDYWIVDLNDDVVEVRRKPVSGDFTEVFVSRRGDALSPLAFPEFKVRVDELLGRTPRP